MGMPDGAGEQMMYKLRTCECVSRVMGRGERKSVGGSRECWDKEKTDGARANMLDTRWKTRRPPPPDRENQVPNSGYTNWNT